MNYRCFLCQQHANTFTEQYCSKCGLVKVGYVPPPSNPYFSTQDPFIVACTNFHEKLHLAMKANIHSDSNISICGHRNSLNTTPYTKNEYSANDLLTQYKAMSVAASPDRRESLGRRGSYLQSTYSVPAIRHDADIENEQRFKEIEKANHFATLEIQADALQASRRKIHNCLTEEEGRRNVSQGIVGNERNKDMNLAIVKQNEMEIIKATDKRKLAEQETAAILQRQEIDALEYTRRSLQLESAQRRREDELADIQRRRRIAELAADEATRRREVLDEYLQTHNNPCAQNVCGAANIIQAHAKATNTDAIVGSPVQGLNGDNYPAEGLCNYCQQTHAALKSVHNSLVNIPIAYETQHLSIPSKPILHSSSVYEKTVIEIPHDYISPKPSRVTLEEPMHHSIVRVLTQPSVHPVVQPSVHPVVQPSVHPVVQPSVHPVVQPSVQVPRVKSTAVVVSNKDLVVVESANKLPEKKVSKEAKTTSLTDKQIKHANSLATKLATTRPLMSDQKPKNRCSNCRKRPSDEEPKILTQKRTLSDAIAAQDAKPKKIFGCGIQ